MRVVINTKRLTMDKYFSDCEKPSLPRNKEEIPNSVWKGIASLIETEEE